MASSGRPASGNGLNDPVACAGRLITDEVVSILQAVDAQTAAMQAAARERASRIRNREPAAAGLARLKAIVRDLDTLAAELEARTARSGRVG
jgi:hypothetical protein